MHYLDTHLVVWLYSGKTALIPKKAQLAINRSKLAISPLVILELEYLFEIKRIKVGGEKIVTYLEKEIGLFVQEPTLRSVVYNALSEKWTRDPFDRLIVSQARQEKIGLITGDELIHRQYNKCVWD